MIEKTLNLDVQILSNIIANFTQVFISYAGQIIGATLILIVGFYVAGKLGNLTRKNLEKFVTWGMLDMRSQKNSLNSGRLCGFFKV